MATTMAATTDSRRTKCTSTTSSEKEEGNRRDHPQAHQCPTHHTLLTGTFRKKLFFVFESSCHHHKEPTTSMCTPRVFSSWRRRLVELSWNRGDHDDPIMWIRQPFGRRKDGNGFCSSTYVHDVPCTEIYANVCHEIGACATTNQLPQFFRHHQQEHIHTHTRFPPPCVQSEAFYKTTTTTTLEVAERHQPL